MIWIELLGVDDLGRRRGVEEGGEKRGGTAEERRNSRVEQRHAHGAQDDAGEAQRGEIGPEQPESRCDRVVRQRVKVAVRVTDDLERRVDLAVEDIVGQQSVERIVAPQAGLIESVDAKEQRQRTHREQRDAACARRRLRHRFSVPDRTRPAQQDDAREQQSAAEREVAPHHCEGSGDAGDGGDERGDRHRGPTLAELCEKLSDLEGAVRRRRQPLRARRPTERRHPG